MGYMPVIPATWRQRSGGLQSEANPGKNIVLYMKNKLKQKRLGVITQVVEGLPTMHEVLSSKSQYQH
jgi:hypothetical protein